MATRKLLSVIIPTYNEKDNMAPLLRGLTQVLDQQGVPHEIIVMDDNSPDGTAAEVERLAATGFRRAKCIVRTTNRGLSPAVIEGFEAAKGEVLLVMDADLQHPIEVVPRLYRRITEGGADVVVGSRHVPGGGIEKWPLKRRVISWGAATLARPLTPCTDPMAGFFALRPEVIKGVKLNAAGFKILLEVLVKGNYSNLQEEPITFRDREHGVSKLSRKVIVNYLLHLISLYLYPGSAPLLKFLAVGATGAILDIAIFTVLIAMVLGNERASVAQIVSFWCAVAWNFTWNRLWTFARPNAPKQKDGGQQTWKQFAKFAAISLVAFAVRTTLYSALKSALGISKPPGLQILLVGVITAVTVVNFVGSKLWAFK